MNDHVYRKAALARLASPEQLHTLMRVTDPKAWLALVAASLLLATAVAWGILGSVPVKLSASGLLVYSGGLADVVAIGSGQVVALEVDVGDIVKRGDPVALAAAPELEAQISSLEQRLRELKINYQRNQALGGRDLDLRARVASEARRNIEAAILANQARASELEERLAKETRLLEQGLITGASVETTRDTLRSVRLSMETLRAEQGRLAVENFSAERTTQATLMAARLEMQDTEQRIKLLDERLRNESVVKSSHDGRVVEVRVNVGDLLVPGTPLVSLERLGKEGTLQALLYVDSRKGKLLQPGMDVQVAPSIVRKERDGVLLAKVKTVESFPSSRQGMLRVLNNEQLVTTLLEETGGTPLAVRAELVPAKDTPTGYRWSSDTGADLVLSSGTRCDGWVITRSERPIALLFPSLALDRPWR
ncbi:MAG TPA: NHLP bacteriocin system secretion protein [Polyangiaceae bacterium]|nr:NHLP bacteriocin system secretion protein [Polyangiaceae bacterium]